MYQIGQGIYTHMRPCPSLSIHFDLNGERQTQTSISTGTRQRPLLSAVWLSHSFQVLRYTPNPMTTANASVNVNRPRQRPCLPHMSPSPSHISILFITSCAPSQPPPFRVHFQAEDAPNPVGPERVRVSHAYCNSECLKLHIEYPWRSRFRCTYHGRRTNDDSIT
ncbi:hypothetical protein BDN70DRAFT_424140 [Pholiota conissans]|uniref:Uncharacterized protein n=1 Tax=Pholiota conissans TaxID=109636 RepID=A0A9P6CN06_9AGAR|nr:hypothetical protein BDN70DRAFT_424140 [Pholiota conissans]